MWIKCQNKRMINTDYFREINMLKKTIPLNDEDKTVDLSGEHIKDEEEYLFKIREKHKEAESKYSGLQVKIYALKELLSDGETYTEAYEILNYKNDKKTAERVLDGIYEDILHDLASDKPCSMDINEMIRMYEKTVI